ncbi:hypothetical protein AG1IA_03570 [Rhizoctonia solani AG-1 IA]|uniref:Uncharacterized protein n=1 Tax=Thanatephorus cucumeris (strain AG1-IA) TaxID=983506 RepID=L8WWD8_THACA|nr:hypothetical protein AG1IA_03570 [Rhizoctonia solani AG-1 IA]
MKITPPQRQRITHSFSQNHVLPTFRSVGSPRPAEQPRRFGYQTLRLIRIDKCYIDTLKRDRRQLTTGIPDTFRPQFQFAPKFSLYLGQYISYKKFIDPGSSVIFNIRSSPYGTPPGWRTYQRCNRRLDQWACCTEIVYTRISGYPESPGRLEGQAMDVLRQPVLCSESRDYRFMLCGLASDLLHRPVSHTPSAAARLCVPFLSYTHSPKVTRAGLGRPPTSQTRGRAPPVHPRCFTAVGVPNGRRGRVGRG